MISAYHTIKEEIFNEQFRRIFSMYEKDKEKAQRILEIQKIDVKKIKNEMESNQIYLSDY